jgi:hypothetical protein
MEYDKLRLDVLIKLIDERGITCKPKKEEIIKHLKMDDEGKYMYDITYEKTQKGYIVGIDIKDHQHLVQMGKFVERGEARRLNRYENNRIIYFSEQKLM